MKFVLLLGLVTLASSQFEVISQHQLNEWNNFKTTHNKNYKSAAEELYRRNVFLDNLDFIQQHNKRFENGEYTFTCGVNEYSDLTQEEFNKQLNGYRRPSSLPKAGKPFKIPKDANIQSKVDWRKKKAVTHVKNQKSCGSCYTFSSTGSLEGQHFIKTGELVSLSEQNLIDCSIDDGNHACYGGWMDKAFSCVVRLGGIDSEKSYPYTSTTTWWCHYNESNSVATATGYVDLPYGDEDSLMAAVSEIGPISVAIDSSLRSFHHYKWGVYNDQNCTQYKLNHAVLAVGYDRTWWFPFMKRHDYWIIKNSWGLTWGELGYVHMARNASNLCGIANEASYPLV